MTFRLWCRCFLIYLLFAAKPYIRRIIFLKENIFGFLLSGCCSVIGYTDSGQHEGPTCRVSAGLYINFLFQLIISTYHFNLLFQLVVSNYNFDLTNTKGPHTEFKRCSWSRCSPRERYILHRSVWRWLERVSGNKI